MNSERSASCFSRTFLYSFQFLRIHMGFPRGVFRRRFEFLLLLLLLFFCSSAAPEVVTVDVHAAKGLIDSGYRYLDVRTTEEFKKGHVDVANILNIPYLFITPKGRVKNPEFLEQVMSVCNKEDRLIVGCQSGVRSLAATSDLVSAGFKDVRDVGGGYLAWAENGLAVTKQKGEL